MKKALVILLALTMVFGAFADPDVTVSVTEFKGEAEFGWKADLEAETTGMYNKDSASLKIQFIDKEATRSTEGEGLWGELVIKAGDKVELEAGKEAWTIPSVSVDKAKIHFVDGDTYVRMSILKPSFAVGGLDYVKATDDAGKDKFAGQEVLKDAKYQGFTIEAGIPMVDVEIAFGDNGDQKADKKEYGFKAAATIKPIDGLEIYGGVACASAENDAAFAAKASYKLALNDTLYVKPVVSYSQKGKSQPFGAGLVVGWGAEGLEPGFKEAYKAGKDGAFDTGAILKGLLENDFSLTVADSKKLGVEDLYKDNFKAEIDAYKDDPTAVPTNPLLASFASDIAPLVPTAAQYEAYAKEFLKAALKEYEEQIAAYHSVLDAAYAAATLPAYNIANKTLDGLTFFFGKDLGDDGDKGTIAINAFDSTLVAGLKLGAKFNAQADKMDKGTVAAAVKYGNDFGILTVDGDFAIGTELGSNVDSTAISYAVKLSTDDIIANTTLFALWDAQNTKFGDKTQNGAFSVGAKIAF